MDTGNKQTENEPLARRGDYLWDGSGEPDREIQRLETLLGRFKHDRPAPVFLPPSRRDKPIAALLTVRPGSNSERGLCGHECGLSQITTIPNCHGILWIYVRCTKRRPDHSVLK